jgi:flagellar protein FliS
MSAEYTYLEDEVLTASPQRLRLMLIDGAIRFARLTISHWQVDHADAASQTLMRCRAIVTELLASVRASRASCEHLVDHMRRAKPLTAAQREREVESLYEAAKNTAGVYVFLFRELTEAQMTRDAGKVNGAIRVLEVERETTRLLCQQQPEAPELDAPLPESPREITARDIAQTDRAQKPAPILGAHHFHGPATYGDASRSSASVLFDE